MNSRLGVGVNANDSDVGPNQLQNFPAITVVVLNGGNLDITYSVPTTSANVTYPLAIEFFITDGTSRSGKTFLGSDTYLESTTPTATVPASGATVGTLISATTTDGNGNTSEFSNPATVSSPLRVAGRPADSEDASVVNIDDLLPIVDAAITIWHNTGLTPSQVHRLRAVDVQISDLPDNLLGLATNNTIVIDVNAAGHDWFVDPTPFDDLEFTESDAQALVQMDLLTAVLHEFGHVLGLPDVLADHRDDLMSLWLETGTRRTPPYCAPQSRERVLNNPHRDLH